MFQIMQIMTNISEIIIQIMTNNHHIMIEITKNNEESASNNEDQGRIILK